MPVPAHDEFFIDPSRCIGCQACVQACRECDSHKGQTMIQLDYVDRAVSTQTVPVVCMHCESPTCAEVCPADAIKRTEDGVVHLDLEVAPDDRGRVIGRQGRTADALRTLLEAVGRRRGIECDMEVVD